MRNAQQWFNEYGVSHQNPTNKLIHWICVPTIFFSIIGLLVSIPHQYLSSLFPSSIAPFINFGTLLLLFGSVFYLMMSFTIFLGMVLISVLALLGNITIQQVDVFPLWQVSLALFTLAWIGQFIGHNIEGAKPSFFKDLQFLMVGPAWLLGFVYKKIGIKY